MGFAELANRAELVLELSREAPFPVVSRIIRGFSTTRGTIREVLYE